MVNINESLAELERSLAPDASILAFLHDPPDKALKIPGHQSRAARYLAAILGESVAVDAIKADSALGDQLAAIAERLPMPTAGERAEWAVGPQDGVLSVHHPLGGATQPIDVPTINESAIAEMLANLCSGMSNRHALFRLLWRQLPERMAIINAAYARLPADTRVPDHSIWNHADTVTAFANAVGATGKGDFALLSFAISPVQSFIATARSLRDLRNGSLLLSWLAFRAMRPVLDRIGPTAFIFPSLRGNAMVDQWLRSDLGGLGSKLSPPPNERIMAAGLPNRFLALVPMGPNGDWAEALRLAVQQAAANAWNEAADKVRAKLGQTLDTAHPDWAERWDTQITQTWDFVAAILPLREQGSDTELAALRGQNTFEIAFPEAARVRRVDGAIRDADKPRYSQGASGRWQISVEMAARLLEAHRGVRLVPITAAAEGDTPAKCSLMGTWETMGPANRQAAAAFREALSQVEIGGARVRAGESLCAVGLVKRFAMGACLADELALERTGGVPRDGRFPDTATLAAACWLNLPGAEQVKKHSQQRGWNGQWLHWAKSDEDGDEPCERQIWQAIQTAKHNKPGPGSAPTYYAVLTLDGDNMGDWLAGKNSPTVREVMHPKLAAYFQQSANGKAGLDARRPVSPSLHAAISEALGNFAQYAVPAIVNCHHGALIYAGGDDVLALLPTQTVLACARDLERAFRGDMRGNGGAAKGYYRTDGRDLLMMGPRATVSAGIAIVHYKEDLRAALEMARQAERDAKAFGRDALCLTAARRSGEHASAELPWTLVDSLASAVTDFANASDRWAYRMRGLMPVFADGGLPEEAFMAELNRQLARAGDDATKNLPVLDFYNELRKRPAPRRKDWQDTAARLITLWQSASFLARGRDVAART